MKTCYDCFAPNKYNLNTYIRSHTVIKSRHTNVKNYSEISRYFSVHVLPCSLRNSKELAKFYHFKLPWRLLALDPCLIYDTDRYGWIWGSLCACAPARRHYSRLPSATPGHHRGLRDLTRVWRQRYQIMVVQALTEQIPEPIVFWFVIFGFVTKCVIHCMFDGMQDSSISTKTWSCKID